MEKMASALLVSLGLVLNQAPPTPPSRPAVPPDLIEGGQRWGHQAQAKLLEGREPKDSFAFAVMGDIENGRFPWQRIFAPAGAFRGLMRLIQADAPDLIVQLGDFVSLGTVDNYRAYLSVLGEEVRIPFLGVIGNHDRSDPHGEADKTLYRGIFGTTDFVYDYNGCRFIGLDTSDSRLTSEQLSWLSAVLQTKRRKLVFMHVPPVYLKGRLKSAGDFDAVELSGFFTEGSAALEELLTVFKVDRVYMGHIHAFAYADHKGVRHILSGGGGSPLYPLPPGYPNRKMAHFIETLVGPAGLRDIVHPLKGEPFALP